MRRNHFAAFRGEHAGGGGVDLGEKFALHAAEQQAHAAALCTNGRTDLRNRFLRREFGKQRFQGPPFFREKACQAQAANKSL